jgi:hypothetical protein
VLAVIFAAVLVVAPVVLLSFAGWASRVSVVRYSFALTPLGFGIWLAHYGFHFFTGLYTLIPITQSALASLGVHLLGEPRWTLVGIPFRFVQPLELGFLVLGFSGALAIVLTMAREDSGERWLRVFLPWAAVCTLLFGSAVWLIFQPMEMRATFLS